MTADSDRSLGAEQTAADLGKRRVHRAEVSLGDEQTLGDGRSGQDTVIDDIEVVDLDARYRVEGTLGQGGMGAVLLATDTRLERKVAIKRILGEAARSKTAMLRFLAEAKAIAALNHPNIVHLYDYGQAKDGPFLIMEYVEGGSLLDRCRESALPLDEAIDLACRLCDGLAKAHDLGIIHRDIKPANVLLTKDGIPKLTDFGLAKAQAGDHGQTMTGAVLGTPDFMPPEQRRDASLVDHRSDLWSLAATIYQMVTGRSPKIIRFDLLPAELTKVLGKALEDTKEARYQSAREFRDALKTSLRASDTGSFELGSTGQCPSCGIANEQSRRFCRGCGGSLDIGCLSCGKPLRVWEAICGECGARQPALIEARRAEIAAQQARAEGLLGDLDLRGAAQIADRLRLETHPALAYAHEWSDAFLARLQHVRQEHAMQAAEEMANAMRHEQAHDYLSAIFSLEAVPEALRHENLPGARETVSAAIARLKTKHAEATRLDKLLRERMAARSFDDLLPVVTRLQELHPERKDLDKLRTQLCERQERQVTARDGAVAKARSHLAAHDYEAARSALRTIPASLETPESAALRREADTHATQARALAVRIREAVAAKRFEGLIDTVEAYLRLKPVDSEAAALRDALATRERKVEGEIAALVEEATRCLQGSQFHKAAALYRRIPEGRRTGAIEQRIATSMRFAEQRDVIAKDLACVDDETFIDVIGRGAEYQRLLAMEGLHDADVATQLKNVEEVFRQRLIARAAARRRSEAAGVVLRIGTGLAMLVGIGFVVMSVGPLAMLSYGNATVENRIGMTLVQIPAGEYMRQVPKTHFKDGESRFYGETIIIKQPFFIGRTEVTQLQWERVMLSTPWRGRDFARTDPAQPVTYIDRSKAEKFCEALTSRERAAGNIDGTMEYRLPMGLEWKYAASAGAQTTFHCGDEPSLLGDYEWYEANLNVGRADFPRNVALKRPTRWGLYDTFGNVREICSNTVCGACWSDDWKHCQINRCDGVELEPAKTGFRVVLAQVGGPQVIARTSSR